MTLGREGGGECALLNGQVWSAELEEESRRSSRPVD